MNNLKNVKNNYLLLTDFTKDILKLCIRETIQGKTVVLFSKKSPDLYAVCMEMGSEISSLLLLDRFVIIECASLEVLTKKLMNLFDWVYVPELVVLDLASYVDAHDSELAKPTENTESLIEHMPQFFQRICLCLSTFLLYMETVNIKMKKECLQKANRSATKPDSAAAVDVDNVACNSLVALKSKEPFLTSDQMDIIINLYYYKDSAFDSLADVLTNITSNA